MPTVVKIDAAPRLVGHPMARQIAKEGAERYLSSVDDFVGIRRLVVEWAPRPMFNWPSMLPHSAIWDFFGVSWHMHSCKHDVVACIMAITAQNGQTCDMKSLQGSRCGNTSPSWNQFPAYPVGSSDE